MKSVLRLHLKGERLRVKDERSMLKRYILCKDQRLKGKAKRFTKSRNDGLRVGMLSQGEPPGRAVASYIDPE